MSIKSHYRYSHVDNPCFCLICEKQYKNKHAAGLHARAMHKGVSDSYIKIYKENET